MLAQLLAPAGDRLVRHLRDDVVLNRLDEFGLMAIELDDPRIETDAGKRAFDGCSGNALRARLGLECGKPVGKCVHVLRRNRSGREPDQRESKAHESVHAAARSGRSNCSSSFRSCSRAAASEASLTWP